jgi:hypothetical protein
MPESRGRIPTEVLAADEGSRRGKRHPPEAVK